MTSRDETWTDAVSNLKRVRLRTMQGDVYAEGEVFAWCDAPTIHIRTDAGERISWRADLSEIVDES